MAETRQQRRARERIATKHREWRESPEFEQVHAKVIGSVSIQQMWRLYWTNRWAPANFPPDVEKCFRHAFYSGCAAMIELMSRVGPDDVSEDRGVEMLQRLHEELETYSKGDGVF